MDILAIEHGDNALLTLELAASRGELTADQQRDLVAALRAALAELAGDESLSKIEAAKEAAWDSGYQDGRTESADEHYQRGYADGRAVALEEAPLPTSTDNT